jgi:hypothetical protein
MSGRPGRNDIDVPRCDLAFMRAPTESLANRGRPCTAQAIPLTTLTAAGISKMVVAYVWLERGGHVFHKGVTQA